MNNSFKYIMENFSRYWKRTFWKDEKGMGVIEVVLIILGILTTYYGVSIKCIT